MDPITAAITFFSGSAFRMVWGEVSHWFTSSREHKYEIQRMRVQAELEAAQHARNEEAIKTQHELGVQVIRVQGEQKLEEIGAMGWLNAVESVGKQIGIPFIDAWNAAIRPALATWAVVMLSVQEFGMKTLSDTTTAVALSVLGIYVADRSLSKRGK
jgi:hypothetical protein